MELSPLFSERHSKTIPDQISLQSLSDRWRVAIWNTFYSWLGLKPDFIEIPDGPWSSRWFPVLQDYWSRVGYPLDECPEHKPEVTNFLKQLVLNGSINEVLDLIEAFGSSDSVDSEFIEALRIVFEKTPSAYRLHAETRQIIPVANEDQIASQIDSLNVLSRGKFEASLEHLTSASRFLRECDFSGSVRESIHAVEAVICLINGKSTTLSDGMKKMGFPIHPAMKNAFEKLYGYTNDERGIRHSFVELDEKVDESEALFMYGACANFCAYLIRKSGAKINTSPVN